MTPNPNPSPACELLPCPFCGGTDGDLVETFTRATEDLMIWAVECERCGAERASDASEYEARTFWNTRTLSPQTLPAPGEVERPLDRNDLYRFMDTLKLSEKREVASAIGFDPSYVPGERDFDRWKRMWLWAAENDKKPALAAAIRSLLPTEALATVAAANDEGVALDWRAIAKLAGEHGVRYRTNTAFEKFLAAIRLLSQGGGK